MALGRNFSISLKKLRGVDSQESVAKKLGLSRATVNRWETKGAEIATLADVEKAGEVFQVSPISLIAGDQGHAGEPDLRAVAETAARIAIERLRPSAPAVALVPADVVDDRIRELLDILRARPEAIDLALRAARAASGRNELKKRKGPARS